MREDLEVDAVEWLRRTAATTGAGSDHLDDGAQRSSKSLSHLRRRDLSPIQQWVGSHLDIRHRVRGVLE